MPGELTISACVIARLHAVRSPCHGHVVRERDYGYLNVPKLYDERPRVRHFTVPLPP
jgi:hypothetical protein